MAGKLRSRGTAREIQGRDAELDLIGEALEGLREGAGVVVIIEGGAGMGKSRLVAEVLARARSRGIAVGSAAADPSESIVELAALLSALFEGREPLLDRRELPRLRAQPEQRFWLLHDLQELLERAAHDSPLLIAIDDCHWADSGTAAALRSLPLRLSGSPIAWLLAARPSGGATRFSRTVDQLRRDGATTLTLGPLDEKAVVRLTTDLLGAQPDAAILALADEAAGSPFLLVELLLGLQEEARIDVVDGRAELVETELPHRAPDGIRDRLGRLSEPANNAVTVAASLGRSFSVSELARTLGRQPSDLLRPLRELLDANLLVERDDRLAFWHDITREAVRASAPLSLRRALDRQAAGVLLEAGALPVEVAAQLAASAEPGDEIAVVTLLEAAEALETSDPTTAAQFGQRALEIAPRTHPRRGEIVATTAIALHIQGNSEEAITFADTSLREAFPPEQEAEVRLGIAGMFAISPEIRIAAGRSALTLPGLPAVLRARHFACLFHNLITAGRIDEGRDLLDEARAAVVSAFDARSAFTLRLAESALEYVDGRFEPSLDLVTTAYRDGIFAGDDQRLRLAHMWHGELLSVTSHDDEALAIAVDGLAAAQRDRQGWAYQMFQTWHGRMLLRMGRLSEAAAVLERRFELEDGGGAAGVLDGAGIVALGRLAIHMGDARQVRRLNAVAQVMFDRGTPAVRRHGAWLLARIAMTEGDATRAAEWLRAPAELDGRSILPRFPLDTADEVQLARIALAAEADDLAALATANVQERALLNPGVTSIAAAAAHVRGLVGGSLEELQQAADLFARGARRLEHASALEDVGAHLLPADPTAAIEVLSRSLESYTEIGALRDARRVRGRLRQLGVRRRVVTVEHEANGWAALTSAELAVARLVAEGLTNREVADSLFVSPHTVNSHVRHIFAKLGINSRVELARLANVQDL